MVRRRLVILTAVAVVLAMLFGAVATLAVQQLRADEDRGCPEVGQ